MNDTRRKKLTEATSHIENAKGFVDDIKSEEEESYENMPEAMQNGDRGAKAQSAIDALGEALDALDQALDHISTAMD